MKRMAFVFLDLFIGIVTVAMANALIYQTRIMTMAIPAMDGWPTVWVAVAALIGVACGLFWCWYIGRGVRIGIER